MKSRKYFFPLMGFVAGVLAGLSIFGLFAFASAPAGPAGSGIVAISKTQAQAYVSNYLSKALPTNAVIKGFTIDKQQVEAMNNIARENPALTGFRIYMGKDNNSAMVGIVVGVDNTGQESLTNTIYSTDSKTLSPCPPICDTQSPIGNQ